MTDKIQDPDEHRRWMKEIRFMRRCPFCRTMQRKPMKAGDECVKPACPARIVVYYTKLTWIIPDWAARK